jgi:aminoglycoside phosphotransferase (APT) family kinase protein
MESIGEWLTRHLPLSSPPTLVHNDYKLDNVIFRSAREVEAVLDWEMATVGDPLADVGLTLCYWAWADAAEAGGSPSPALTSRPGWYDREQFLERYSKRAGRNISGIVYYEVLGMFKLAVILQQIYYRFRRGQTRDERFRQFDQRVAALARQAAYLAERQA